MPAPGANGGSASLRVSRTGSVRASRKEGLLPAPGANCGSASLRVSRTGSVRASREGGTFYAEPNEVLPESVPKAILGHGSGSGCGSLSGSWYDSASGSESGSGSLSESGSGSRSLVESAFSETQPSLDEQQASSLDSLLEEHRRLQSCSEQEPPVTTRSRLVYFIAIAAAATPLTL